mmetsp:Transcript_103354/g.236832  ORF Transcript_103354/g.236832 Transcript_103354/m.236832 type:complete len:184 (+) Transcript_103354:1169-1720(+)
MGTPPAVTKHEAEVKAKVASKAMVMVMRAMISRLQSGTEHRLVPHLDWMQMCHMPTQAASYETCSLARRRRTGLPQRVVMPLRRGLGDPRRARASEHPLATVCHQCANVCTQVTRHRAGQHPDKTRDSLLRTIMRRMEAAQTLGLRRTQDEQDWTILCVIPAGLRRHGTTLCVIVTCCRGAKI